MLHSPWSAFSVIRFLQQQTFMTISLSRGSVLSISTSQIRTSSKSIKTLINQFLNLFLKKPWTCHSRSRAQISRIFKSILKITRHKTKMKVVLLISIHIVSTMNQLLSRVIPNSKFKIEIRRWCSAQVSEVELEELWLSTHTSLCPSVDLPLLVLLNRSPTTRSTRSTWTSKSLKITSATWL